MEWFSQFELTAPLRPLTGDKITLPQSALENLLANSPISNSSAAPSHGSDAFGSNDAYAAASQRYAQSRFDFRDRQLPNPITFKIVNPKNDRVVYAGIREFSAEEGEINLSPFLLRALGVSEPALAPPPESDADQMDDDDNVKTNADERMRLSVHFERLSKGTFVKLRPLEAGYDPDDWKALLESHLRTNYTTLTKGEILDVPVNSRESFQFLIDEFRPSSNAICVVDTDLEVDIEAMNEEQARETLKRVAEKHKLLPGTGQGSSRGGPLQFGKPTLGQVLDGEYVNYELLSWPRTETIELSLDTEEDDQSGQLDILVNPFSSRQRAKPREDEHVLANFEDKPSKRLRVSPSNVNMEDAESLHIAVHAALHTKESDSSPALKHFTIKASISVPTTLDSRASTQNGVTPRTSPDEVVCQNCRHVIPKQSIVLHENFCRRNNLRCPYSETCDMVFQHNSPALKEHWHCDKDTCESSGSSQLTRAHHDRIFHTPVRCPSCSFPDSFPSFPVLAQHRISLCPGKEILCRFCHLVVPQEGTGADPFAIPDAEVVLSGLTAHEVADGGRTTECHMCNRIVRLRDMETHLKTHDFERLSKPVPRVCRNVLCGRTLDGANMKGDTRSSSKIGQGPRNDVGLCSFCFAPLYVSLHDPEGKALKRRVERKYLSQLISGCGKQWCRNPLCKSGRTSLARDNNHEKTEIGKSMTLSEAMPLAKPYVDGLMQLGGNTPLHLCTDETNQRRRSLATMLSAEGSDIPAARMFNFEWCMAAIEACNGDTSKAHEWLKNFAPSIDEEAAK